MIWYVASCQPYAHKRVRWGKSSGEFENTFLQFEEGRSTAGWFTSPIWKVVAKKDVQHMCKKGHPITISIFLLWDARVLPLTNSSVSCSDYRTPLSLKHEIRMIRSKTNCIWTGPCDGQQILLRRPISIDAIVFKYGCSMFKAHTTRNHCQLVLPKMIKH